MPGPIGSATITARRFVGRIRSTAATASSWSGGEDMTQVGHPGAVSATARPDHTSIAISNERTRAS